MSAPAALKNTMKIDCPRKEFFEAVSAAFAASSTRTSVNILQNLKIEATGDGVRVLGCDGEMWVERTFPCLVTNQGAICLQAKLLNDLVSAMPDGPLELRTLDGNGVMLSQGASEYRMLSLDAEDFPEPQEVTAEGELTIQMGLLRKAVDSVIFAVSSDQHRQVLTGVLFHYNGQVLTLVATDTHRLAVRKLDQPGIGSSLNAVVPEKAVRAIKSMPVSDDTEVVLRFGGGRIGVESNGAKVISQLLAGTYPNWERVVPTESTRSWTVEVDQLDEKVGRILIVARDNANRVRFKGGEDQIVISARSDEKGEAKEEIPMVAANGDVEIAFNGAYVREALQPITSAGVRIEMTESSRPALFRAADGDTGFFCVIMPMALG